MSLARDLQKKVKMVLKWEMRRLSVTVAKKCDTERGMHDQRFTV